MPLHYAIEHGNTRQIQWLFQLGVGAVLTVTDIEELLHLNSSKSIRDQLLREVELVDTANQRIQSEASDSDGSEKEGDGQVGSRLEPGISVFLAVKLERDVASLFGPLLQSPLLRAAMFGNRSAAELLLARGADAGTRDANGWTVLHVRPILYVSVC